MEITIGSKTFRLEIMLLLIIVFWVLFGNLLCGCCRVSLFEGLNSKIKKEGFSSMGPQFAGATSNDFVMDPSKWSLPSLAYSPGATPSPASKSILDRPSQPIPLPKDEMLMFATTDFKPECCPNTYSSSTGCACMSVDQYKYLGNRGGNNVPYSEY
jgi:hypothetical protein